MDASACSLTLPLFQPRPSMSSPPAVTVTDERPDASNAEESKQQSADPSEPQEETLTMADLYARMRDDALQAQTLAARCGRELERCSYDDGAITQPVYCSHTQHTAAEQEDRSSGSETDPAQPTHAQPLSAPPAAVVVRSPLCAGCRSCYPAGDVGVCLGCSMNCHIGSEHQVEELFEKRAFTCDCGNDAARSNVPTAVCCTLQPIKSASNPSNTYNHNFRGEYCRCNGIYKPEEDVMICCVLCQDWFVDTAQESMRGQPRTASMHGKKIIRAISSSLPIQSAPSTFVVLCVRFHDRCLLGGAVPPAEGEDSRDLICAECLAKPANDVLLPYLALAEEEAAATAAGAASNSNTPSVSRSVSLTAGTPLARRASLLASVAAAAASSASPAAAAVSASPAATSSVAGGVESKSIESEPAPALIPADLSTPSRKRKADELEATATGPSSAAAAAASSPASAAQCHRPIAASVGSVTPASAVPSASPADRFVPSFWNELLCACTACTGEYHRRGLMWLLEEEPADGLDTSLAAAGATPGAAASASAASAPAASSSSSRSVLSRMTDADIAAPLAPSFDAEVMVGSYVESMPRSLAADIVTPYALFQESIKKQLQLFAERCPGVVVTAEVMREIVREAKEESQETFQQIKRARFAGESEALPE